MAKMQNRAYNKYDQIICDLQHLMRSPYETPTELVRFRQRVDNERAQVHLRILETIANEAHINLQPILEDARRRNDAKRRLTTQLLKKLESRAAEAAKLENEHFHQIRLDYLKSFGGKPPLAGGETELKFHKPIQWSSAAQEGQCNMNLGSWCGTIDFGNHEASADIAQPGAVGIYLYPYINSNNGDCEDSLSGHTFQDLTYQMDPPNNSFAVNSVRVDLIGFGIASSHLGDFSGLFEKADPLYVHSSVHLDVYIAQQINGQWQQWQLLSDTLFTGKGDYARNVRFLLSGQTYPVSVVIRKPDIGGGDVLCHLQLTCQSLSIGSDGRVCVDFRDYGIFAGGVALIGNYV